MKPQITAVLSSFIIVGLLFAFASCGHSQSEIDAAREEGYKAGYEQAIEENKDIENALEAARFEGFCEGMSECNEIWENNSDVDYIANGVLEEARSYASENADITLLDAMDIVSVYLDGYDPSGYPLPTKREFEEAVDVLLRYAIFLEWNMESYSEIMEDVDPLYG